MFTYEICVFKKELMGPYFKKLKLERERESERR